MVIDTIADVVIGDVGDEVVNTAGVAVRPFWWSTDCLAAMGLATTGGGSEPSNPSTTETTADQTTNASDLPGSAGDETGGDRRPGDADGGSADPGGLAGGWIALIAILAVIAVAALSVLAYMLGRTRGSGGDPLTGVAPAGRDEEPPAFCRYCGGSLTPGAKYCSKCGRPA